MLKYRREFRRFHRSFWGAVALLILLGFLLQNVAGSVYYGLVIESSMAVSSAPVELQEGTVGNSTVYTNGTSAKVSVSGYGYDFVDNNDTDVDLSADKGTHSNFTAQKYGPDLINDTLTEENTESNPEYVWISGNDNFVRKLNKSDLGGTEILSWDTDTSYPFGTEFRIENGSEYIYIVDYGSQADALIKFHANNGTEVTRWDIEGYSGNAYGLTWNGSRWFIADSSDDLIYQVDPANATNYERSFSYTGIQACEGLAWDGSYLWTVDSGTDKAYQIDIYGNIQTSWDATANPTGIAYDTTSGHLWIASESTDYLHEYYTNGTEINSWDPSGTNPQGVAYASVEKTYNYELDLEVQWTNVDYDEQYEYLCIYAGELNTHSLDATGGYMIIGDGTPDWGSTTGTISFWIKMDASVQGRFWGQHADMETRFSGGSYLILDWGGDASMTSAYSFSADTWYFVAIVWDENNDNLFLYVGDENNAPTLDANSLSGTWASTTPSPTENRFMNGLGANESVDGHGDDLRYWNTDRTLAQIQSDYDIQLTGSETNLRSYFKLNNDFNDIGPDNNDGSGSGSYSFSPDVSFDAPPTENIRVDVRYNSAWQNVFTNLTNGWNNVSVGSYLTTSNFTIRFNGDTEIGDTTQDTWNIDATLLHIWTEDFNYVLNMTEKHNSNWKVRLKAYDNSSLSRIDNCSIYIYDGSNSTQIIILNGAYNQQTGPWYDLNASDTEYIWIHVETSSAGTSTVYVYLEIRVPNKTVYARYIITFEIN